MGRPPLNVGETGTIRSYARIDGKWYPADDVPDNAKPDKWRAMANYRGSDGLTVPVERRGPTKAKAENALKAEISSRIGVHSAALSARSRFSDFATLWAEDAADRLAKTTMKNYRIALTKHVLPHIGELRIREIKVGRMEDFFRDLKKTSGLSPGALRIVRTVVKQTLDIAVRRDLYDHNPVSSVSRISGGPRRTPRALGPAELGEFLNLVDGDKGARRCDLPDLIWLMLGTGLRIGEALGLRWCDIDLAPTAERSVLHVTGNVVYVDRQILRHGGKTFAARRDVGIPAFLHTLLWARKPDDASPEHPVFPDGADRFRNPQVVHMAIMRMRERISPEDEPERWTWFTSHVLRKTAATQLDEAGQSPRQVADQLGHADPSMTLRRYMGRGLPNASAAAALDAAHRPTGEASS